MRLKTKSCVLIFTLLQHGIFGQVTNNINAAIGNGDYTAQQTVKLMAPSGHASSTGNQNVHLFIDKTIVTPAVYQTLYVWNFPIRTIDKTLAPGSIVGDYNVDAAGSFNYQIPVTLPPGTNGMVPKIGLSYNSNGGDNEVGMGWGIGGLSVISRVPADQFHEGLTNETVFSATGPYALDGNRMVSQGVNGSAQDYYYTENETFSQVTFVGPHFEVKTKAGLTNIYGGTTDSRLAFTQGVVAWYLNKTIDNFGNYIEYSYSNVGNEVVINEIRYTGNAAAGITPYNTVKFFYDQRVDIKNEHVLKNVVQKKLILREIDVYGEGSPQMPASSFNFSYTYGSFTYLSEILYSGMNGEKLNSTAFIYGHVPNNFNRATYAPTTFGTNHNFASADFNGDGLSDLIDFQYNPNSIDNITGTMLYTNWHLFLNNGNSFGLWPDQTITETFLPFSNFNNLLMGITPVKNGFLTADVMGDPAPELIYGKDANGILSSIQVYKFDKTTNQMVNSPSGFTVRVPDPDPNKAETLCLSVGDFDGNGKSELITFWKGNSDFEFTLMDFVNGSSVLRSPSSTGISVTDLNNVSRPLIQYSDFTAFDFDGDGRSELIGKRNGLFVVIKVDAVSQSNFLVLTEIIANNSSSFNHSLFGDYNGDGKPDFIVQGTSDLTIFYGTGQGFTNGGTISGYGLSNNLKLIAMDGNGDGKTDLIKFDNAGTGTDISICFGSRLQDGFHGAFSSIYDIPTIFNDEIPGNMDRNLDGQVSVSDEFTKNSPDIPMFEVADFNGDGFQDILYKEMNPNEPVRILNFNVNYSDEKYITKILDGNDNEINISYSSLPQLSALNRYFKSPMASAIANVYNRTLPISVVSTVIDKRDGVSMRNEFDYYNILCHSKGRGILGFDKVVKKRIHPVTLDNYQVTDEYDLDATFLTRMFKTSKSEFISSGNTTVYSTTSYNSSFQGLGANITTPASGARAQRYFSKLNLVSTVNKFINSTTNETFTYDSYGNITNKQTDIGPGKQITQQVYTNFVNAGSWCPNVPEDEIVTITRSGESPYNVTVHNNHNLANGFLSSVINDPGMIPTKTIVKTNVYDPNTGVPTQVTISAPNDSPVPVPNVTSYQYDPKFRFVEKTFSPLGYTSEVKYETVFGNPVTKKDASGLISSYKYDNFGQLTEVTRPDGFKTNYYQEWFVSNDPLDPKPVGNDAQFVSTTISSDGSRSAEILDRYGRKLKTETNTYDGKKFSNLITYNNRGEVYKLNGPYLVPLPQGKVILETTNTYRSDIGELTSSVVSDGSMNLTTTHGWFFSTSPREIHHVVTTPDGKQKTQIKDETGLLINTVDNGLNWLSYEYHFNGTNFINITKFNNSDISITKTDRLKHIIEENEPNSGTKTHIVNSFGQLKSTTDNKGTIFTYDYDLLDRLTQKTIGADYYNYTYNNSGPGMGEISQIVTSTGPSKKYSYDNLQRLLQIEEIADGTSYFSKYEYDNFSRPVKHAYPNNFYTTFEYANGELTKIKGTNSTIWELNKLDNSGSINRYVLADGATTLKSFDNFGYATEFNVNNIQYLGFNYNKSNGNMNSYTDLFTGSVEQYGFDALDRLTSINNSNYPAVLNTTYDLNGNITSKYDAGGFTYNGAKVNQVIQATNTNADISLLPQNINYNLFNKPTYIEEGVYSCNLFYGVDKQRYKTTFSKNNSLAKTRYYLNGYEKTIDASTGKITEINYVEAPSGLCAMNVVKDQTPNLYSVYNDHVGSIVALTDQQGNIVAQQNFDAWGRRRNPIDHSYTNLNAIPDWLYRGYTGHEHLPEFDLINMNGRMYDPKLGRMLSVDPVLLDPTNSQDYNKYTYAANNPVKYTDPTGNFYLDEIPVVYAAMALFIAGDLLTHGLNMAMSADYRANPMFNGFGGAALHGYSAYNQVMSMTNIPLWRGQSGNSSYGVSAYVSFGAGGLGIGVSADYNYKLALGNGSYVNLGVSAGGDLHKSAGPGHAKNQGYVGAGAEVGSDDFRVGFSTTQFFSGKSSQRLGGITAAGKDWSVNYQNDGGFLIGNVLGDGGDNDRTAALRLSYKEFSAGFNLLTEKRVERVDPATGKTQYQFTGDENWKNKGTTMRTDTYQTTPSGRLGGFYVGHGNNFIGFDNDHVRKKIQNDGIHDLFNIPHFINSDYGTHFYGGYWPTKKFSLW